MTEKHDKPVEHKKPHADPKHKAPKSDSDIVAKIDYAALATAERALQDPGFVDFLHKSLPEDHPHTKALKAAVPKGAAKTAFDIGSILALLNGPLGQLLIGLIAQWTAPKPVVVPPPVVPPPVTPPVVVPPVVVPPPPPVSTRKVASGATTIIGVENWNGKPNGHASLGGGTVANIRNGSEFCGAGYRVHLNSTPKDAAGVPFYNSDLHNQPLIFCQFAEQVVQDATGKWTCGESRNRISHYITIDGQEYGPMGDMVGGDAWSGQAVVGLTSETDDGACTPVILINYDVPLGQEFDVSYRAEYVAPDGTTVAFAPTPTWKVKAWSF